jgi:CspA family cold shock protein
MPARRLGRLRAVRAGFDRQVGNIGINSNGYRSLPEGARVSYEEEQGDKGPKAVNVTSL